MAIKGITNCRGLEVPNAYIRVNDVRVDNIGKTASATITLHANPESGPLPIDGENTFSGVPIIDDNPVKSVYDHIKTMEMFSEFKDC